MANRFSKYLNALSQHAVASAFIFIVLMLIIPFPAQMIDLMMIINLALGIIILLTVVYTPRSADLTSFPRVILFATIYGLALNVGSTRYILSNGYLGLRGFDGEMIKAFARIVAGENLVIGFVIFIVLIIIQTLVFTKGTTRISEVQARFALDSMNSKMFAVDSELNSGAITDEQAREKKAQIQRESDFYSSMDGASKFVSGNVKAGIAITVINLVAGIIIAMVLHGTSWSDAINTFPMLTIGDGLLSQLPSLLLSVATGILVAGSNSSERFDEQLKKEFTVSGYVYEICGGVLFAIGLLFMFIGGSKVLFLLLAGVGTGMFFVGRQIIRNEKITIARKIEEKNQAEVKSKNSSKNVEVSPVVPLDPLCLELGIGLVSLVDKQKGAELLERVTRIRREAALDLGLVVPSIRIIDNLTLDPEEYSFKIRGIEAGRSKLKMHHYMCLNTGSVIEEIKGEATRDPAFGVPAIWVPEDEVAQAERNGYSIVDPPTIIATHMTEIIRSHAADILTREEVSAIINKIKESNPVVVGEVLDTYKYTYGEIEKIFQGLLREKVSIRNIVTILETLANYGMYPHDPFMLIEKVREALGKQICLQYVDPGDPQRKLSVIQVSQAWAQKILEHTITSQNGSAPIVAFDPVDGRKWINAVSGSIAALRERNLLPVILCPTPEVRQLVHQSIDRELPGTVVISLNEVIAAGSDVNIEILGEISE